MEISYKQDMAHSFLVIGPEGEVDMKAYPLRMVLGNAIPGLLPCRLQKADGKVLFYYEITARQQIADVYQKLTYGDIKKIFLGLLKIFEQMDMYLLDTGQLFLEPGYVYLDRAEDTLYLCYLPGYDRPIQEQLRGFMEYLLPCIEHKDQRGVILGYGLYRLLMEDGFQMEAVSEMLHRPQWEPEKEPKTLTEIPGEVCREDWEDQEMPEEERDERGAERERVQRDEWKKGWKRDLLLLLAGFILIGGFAAVRQIGYLGDVSLPLLLVFFFSGILLAALTVWRGRKKEEKRGADEERTGLYEEEMEWEPEEESYLQQGDETVVLYKDPGYGCPMLVCEEAGQAPLIRLERDMAVVGKMDGVSDVLLDSPSISRIHARIQKKGDGYWIADLDSKNGTFVNGKKLGQGEEYLLQEDDLVVFADIGYRFNV